ncbi:Hypothetical protein ABZS17D1_02144 [Kosakonia cowanii]
MRLGDEMPDGGFALSERRMAALPYPAYGCWFGWAMLGDEMPDIGFALSGLRVLV